MLARDMFNNMRDSELVGCSSLRSKWLWSRAWSHRVRASVLRPCPAQSSLRRCKHFCLDVTPVPSSSALDCLCLPAPINDESHQPHSQACLLSVAEQDRVFSAPPEFC